MPNQKPIIIVTDDKLAPKEVIKYKTDRTYIARHQPVGRKEKSHFDKKLQKDKRDIEAIAFPISVLAALLADCIDKGYSHFGVFFDHFNRLNEIDPEEPDPKKGGIPADAQGIPAPEWHGVTLAPLPYKFILQCLQFETFGDAQRDLDPNDTCYSGGTPIPPPPNNAQIKSKRTTKHTKR